MAKLVKCKKCGTEIQKTAKVCPNCGAKQHIGAGIACGIIILVAMVAVIAILVSNPSTTTPSAGGAHSEAPKDETIAVTATDLWSAYDANSVSADSQYKGNMLAVTGEITNIGQDILTKKPCIFLAAGDNLGIYSIECFFPDDDDTLASLAELSDGQTVTITGKCTGVSVANVQLSRCSIG